MKIMATGLSHSLAVVFLGLVLASAAIAQEAAPRSFLSIDYRSHSTFQEAVRHSLRPTDVRANTGAVLTNTLHPLSPLRYVLAIMGIEAQKQIISGEGLDFRKLVSKLEWKSLTLGYVGSQAGDYIGAAAQAFLGSRLGVAGGVVGFALRPLLWYLGSTMGQSVGRQLGRPKEAAEAGTLATGAAAALTTFEPVKDSFRMMGEAGGALLGQALIPVPVVGACIGGAVGSLATLLVARGVEKTKAGKELDSSLRMRLKSLALKLRGVRESLPSLPGAFQVPVIAPPRGSRSALEASRERGASYQQVVESLRRGDPTGAREALEAYGALEIPRPGP